MKPKDFKLGQRVRVTREYKRRNSPEPGSNAWRKKWVSTEVEPYEGVLIGSRIIQDGLSFWADGTWQPVNRKRAYLVTTSLHRNPARVPEYAIFESFESEEKIPCHHYVNNSTDK